MRRIRIIANISLDGVIQAPGGPDEDRDGGFAHGGWAMRHFDPAMGGDVAAAQGETFDLLVGRRTYDIFASYWPTAENDRTADALNRATKYVATHRPETLGWGPAEGLGRDIGAHLRELKAQGGRDIIVWGSSTLTPLLFEQGLVDEVLLFVFPILLGEGKRFFSGRVAPRELALVNSRPASSGALANMYRPVGPLQPDSRSR
ncbi:dihydrofolate reductase family protein [Aquibium sp. A9E412]|uniref:dihydrofolate reductase family protein n=1 Tax=Aquibium sp. A9E412 TaxID=2976767 RepID=UPI0025B22266|nr:dihydrofolate reductase family protein [Aquibium sp. A9E412]MDN2565794.1 dihydrofolate reductase family protein [Aquibium sp. A9E412]